MIGTRVGHFEIVRRLGRGSTCQVFLARDEKLDRLVALKILSETLLQDDLALRRFQREARSVAALTHPGLAGIYEVDVFEGRPYLVLEYVEGPTLAEQLKEHGPLRLEAIIPFATELAEALGYAHQKDLIHRDVKSPNIVVSPTGKPKLLDMGLMRHHFTTQITRSGMITGSAAYISPEQALDQAVTVQSDIWSLGVVLYEATTGQLPFEGENVISVLTKVLHEEPIPPSKLRPGLPPTIESAILRCLSKDPGERFPSTGALVEALTGSPGPLTSTNVDRPPSLPKFSNRPPSALVLILAGVAIIAVLTLLLLRR